MAKATDDRVTPRDVMDAMRATYGDFDLDAAATRDCAQAPAYFGPDRRDPNYRDALADSLHWYNYGNLVWLNCPYSEIPRWLAKVKREVKGCPDNGFRVVCLLPTSTSTTWWHLYVWNARRRTWRPLVRSVQFWPKRIVFGPHQTGAKWPSVVVEFGRP